MDSSGLSPLADLDSSSGGSDSANVSLQGFNQSPGLYLNQNG